MSEETTTPRTDSHICDGAADFGGMERIYPTPKDCGYISVEFAQELETELTEAHATIKRLTEERDTWNKLANERMLDLSMYQASEMSLKTALARVEEQDATIKELLDDVESATVAHAQAEARVEELTLAMKTYSVHRVNCALNVSAGRQKCTCGLAAAMTQA